MRTKRPVMVVATGEVEVGVKESEMEMTMKVDRLRDILSLHAKWLRGEKGGRRANLACANLTGADLPYAELTDAELTYAELAGAYLTRAKLAGSNLTAANLAGADLADAELTSIKNESRQMV